MNKHLLISLLTLWWSISSVSAISRGEYFIDQDPGLDRATSIAVNPAQTNWTINTSGLTNGLHHVGIRVVDDRIWSQTYIHPFFKVSLTPEQQRQITAAEYWIDTDPGFGQGQTIAFTPNQTDFSFTADLSTLAIGVHTIGVRIRKGFEWSEVYVHPFIKVSLTPEQQRQITAAEYWIDTDPGFGQGQTIAFTPNQTDFTFSLPEMKELPLGEHVVGVRVRQGYTWSQDYIYAFNKQVTYTISAASPDTIQGRVEGGGIYAQDSIATLIAVPNDRYRFVRWSDGDTINPRQVVVTQDSSFVAEFIQLVSWQVESNDNTMGVVQTEFLDSLYDFGTQVSAVAVPNSGYKFIKWNDGNKNSTYMLTLLTDTYLRAIFMAEEEEPDTTVVTPSDNTATFEWPLIEGGYNYTLTVYADAACTQVICVMVFDENGQLISTTYEAPSRDGQRMYMQESNFSCTIAGLLPNNQYFYKMETTDEEGKLLNTDEGGFKTSAVPTFVERTLQTNTLRKVVINNQFYILYQNNMFNSLGIKIK